MSRVCIFSPHTGVKTGIGSVVTNVASEFNKIGWEVLCVTEKGDFTKGQLLVNFRSKNPLSIIKSLFQIFQFAKNVDLILLYDVRPAGLYALILSKIKKKPLYLHCVGTHSLFLSNENLLKNFLMKIVYNHSSKTFVLSKFVKKQIEASDARFKFYNESILGPGARQDFFKDKIVTKIIKKNYSYILTVGEVKSRKGHDLSIEAFARICSKFPDLRYLIVGKYDKKSPFFGSLLNKIKNYNLLEKIVFLGEVEDEILMQLYSDALFFIMTPRTTKDYLEGFGIVYLEAALSGVTSIGSYNSGAEDAIVHEVTGLLCDPNAIQIALAMENLLANSVFRSTLASEAKKRAKLFTWEYVIRNYINNYQRIKDS